MHRNALLALMLALPLTSCAKQLVQASFEPGGDCRKVGGVTNGDEPEVGIYQQPDGVVSFQANMNILLDGSARAYRASDPGHYVVQGNKRVLVTDTAPETICSGTRLVNAPAGDSRAVCERRVDVFNWLRSNNWPATKPDGTAMDFYAFEMRVSGNGRREPCILDGDWIVSQNALAKQSSPRSCDPERWIDALTINGIVAPPRILKLATPKASLGDLVVVRYRGVLAGGIVSEANNTKAGEASAAMAAELRKLPLPTVLADTYRLNVGNDEVEYFIFPGTKGRVFPIANTTQDNQRVKDRAIALARQFGIEAKPSRRACGHKPPPPPPPLPPSSRLESVSPGVSTPATPGSAETASPPLAPLEDAGRSLEADVTIPNLDPYSLDRRDEGDEGGPPT